MDTTLQALHPGARTNETGGLQGVDGDHVVGCSPAPYSGKACNAYNKPSLIINGAGAIATSQPNTIFAMVWKRGRGAVIRLA